MSTGASGGASPGAVGGLLAPIAQSSYFLTFLTFFLMVLGTILVDFRSPIGAKMGRKLEPKSIHLGLAPQREH